LFFIASGTVFLLDLLIKRFVISMLTPLHSFPIIKGMLHLTYVENTGVAFGLMKNQRPFLILVGIIVCALIIIFYKSSLKSEILLRFALALILGGSLGNLFDRVFYGHVIDYIDLRVFPVFNLADISINVGIALVLIDQFIRRNECTRS
jgi:signal peptidase II